MTMASESICWIKINPFFPDFFAIVPAQCSSALESQIYIFFTL